jgi:hypothetical protein
VQIKEYYLKDIYSSFIEDSIFLAQDLRDVKQDFFEEKYYPPLLLTPPASTILGCSCAVFLLPLIIFVCPLAVAMRCGALS